MDPSTYNKIDKGKRGVSPQFAKPLALALGVGRFDLLTEIGAPISFEEIEEPAPASVRVAGDTLNVPEIDVSPQAGMGAVVSDIVEHQQPIDHWSFPRALVSAFISDPSKLTIIRVAGDSMEPDYCAGDRILVDTGHTTPSPAGVYVLWDGLGVVLKRVEVVMGSEPKRIRIMSINPAYPAYELALDDVRINGRVVGKWTWK
ncbi:helix-turn-helix transcriptional regulator [Gluconobacter albidus]|nr:helix-turn-helix transcriptional regulator [Gluconobacter albidus]